MAFTCFGHLHVHLQEFLYTTLYIRTPEDGHVNVRNM